MPRDPRGRPAAERPGRLVVDEAIEWLAARSGGRFFLWVHLFEPHAPYGEPGDKRPAAARYDEEIAEADRQTGRLFEAIGDRAASTLIVVTADHGEAFGEHGEIAHSIFIYDTTLRVPLVVAGPAVPPRVVTSPVGLVDLAPTVMRLLGVAPLEGDGIDLTPALDGQPLPDRLLYAESFAPLLDFGWSPLERAPDFHEARLNLGIAYQESGDQENAAATYRELLDTAPARFAREREAANALLRQMTK